MTSILPCLRLTLQNNWRYMIMNVYLYLITSLHIYSSFGYVVQIDEHSRANQYSASETCQRRLIAITLIKPGCTPKRVLSSACKGTCHSRSIPEWQYAEQHVTMIKYCTCCSPLHQRERVVKLNCPGKSRRYKHIPVRVTRQCACRPCSDADPASEHPYSY